jgi:hypothetical protein
MFFLVAVVIAFFFCYAPLYLQRLIIAMTTLNSNFNPESYLFSKIMAYLYVISGMTFYFGSAINPILYNVVSNKYRRAFRDLVCCQLPYKKKANVKQRQQQRKFLIQNRANHQPVKYFVTKTAQQQQQQHQEAVRRTSVNGCIETYRKTASHSPMDHRTVTLIQTRRPILVNSQLSLSNSSSMSSQQNEACRARFNRCYLSMPSTSHIDDRTKFSLRRNVFGSKQQATDNLPWLANKPIAQSN